MPRGGATVCKLGGQNRAASEASEKKFECAPQLVNVGGAKNSIYQLVLYTTCYRCIIANMRTHGTIIRVHNFHPYTVSSMHKGFAFEHCTMRSNMYSLR